MESNKSIAKANKMPADKKVTKKAEAPAADAAAPKAAKAPRKVAEKKVKEETAAPVADAAPAAPSSEVRSASDVLSGLQDHLKALGADVTARIRAAVHEALEASKALKRDARESKRRRRKDPSEMTEDEKKAWEARRANNAFLKPRPLSDELCSFMGLAPKSQKNQTEVTKFISNYVKTHNCFDPTFKRRIIPDQKLGKLLRVKDGQEVTYLNLQSFLKVHFLKPSA